MRTAGVDLASQPAATALCVVDWDGPRVEALQVGVTDDEVLALVEAVDRIGVDAPFGWPVPFADAVASWASHGPWPSESSSEGRDALRFRVTDWVIRDTVTRRWPLSVSSDLIAVTTFRCVRLLSAAAIRLGTPVDRTGVDGPFVETYPAAALCAWDITFRGYKGAKGQNVRTDVVTKLAKRFPWLDPVSIAAFQASDHSLDAFVCAVIAAEAAHGRTTAPKDDEQLAAARIEGWIHAPLPGT